jgi:hypothetical protein
VFDATELTDLGERMTARKEELLREIDERTAAASPH